MTNARHNTIDYIEIGATDMAVSRAFYATVFDWQFTEYGPSYLGIQHPSGEGEMGGMCPAETVNTGGPLVILYSADIEATLEAVKAAGGTITTETFSFPGGQRFHFTDPAGNELAVWTQ
ncbi:MAG: putative enzyme related to lactoylglutathione lyase [Flavobacteriales bacterium]|jgi:predicted enzyme related to lactoylglutathione lyase